MSFLRTIKQKPPQAKTRYAFVGAFVLTLIVAGIWTTTLPARFSEIRTSVNGLGDAAPVSNTGAALNGLKDTLSTEQDGFPQDERTDNTFDFSPEPATSALNELSGPYTNDKSYQNESSQGAQPSTTLGIDEQSTPTGTATSNPPTMSPQASQTPRTILIATTTTKNNE